MERAEAIKKIRQMSLPKETMEILEALAPELKESEDERIRKAILGLTYLDGIEPILTKCSITRQEIRSYLEKQKEQKPDIELIQRSWYMEGYHDREFGQEPKWIIKTGEGGPKHELNPRYGEPIGGEQKPAEWSDKDEKHINSIFNDLKQNVIPDEEDQEWLKNRFKFLRPWKPSEEQMEVLAMAVTFFKTKWTGAKVKEQIALESLYEQLKAL